MDDFREDYDVPCKIKFNDEEFDAIFVQGHDGSGSCGTEEQFLLNASKLLDGYWPENISKHLGDNPMGGKKGDTMYYRASNKNQEEIDLVGKINRDFDHICILSSSGILSSRIRIGKHINKFGDMLKGRCKEDFFKRPNAADLGLLILFCDQYSNEVSRCTNDLIMEELHKIHALEKWASQYILDHIVNEQRDKAISAAISKIDIEKHLAESKDHSQKFKVVVSRDCDGVSTVNYKIRSPLLSQDTDDACAIKDHFNGWDKFLKGEDGKLIDPNLRDITVREVRLGKIVAKLEPVQEVVYKVVKK
jgi:hypothetical protein